MGGPSSPETDRKRNGSAGVAAVFNCAKLTEWKASLGGVGEWRTVGGRCW